MVLVKIRLANKLFFHVHHACTTFKSSDEHLKLGTSTYIRSFSIQFWEITLHLFKIQCLRRIQDKSGNY